jgi:hypothetical protein
MRTTTTRRAVLTSAPARRTAKGIAAVSALALLLSAPAAMAAPLPTTFINDPPAAGHLVSAFPARDFVSAQGYRLDETYTVEVHHSPLRGGAVVSSQSGIRPDNQGLVEVNHPGGGCWVGVTPNIVAGDLIRVVVDSSPDPARIGVADQTTVADVTAARPTNPAPGTIVVRGTARAADGTQFPLDQIDSRLVAPGKIFDLGGKRSLRAPGAPGSSMQYDAAGSTNWTATWTGLSDHDVKLALGAQSMGSWLGRTPAANNETTVYETGAGIAGGPQGLCAAPKEKLPPLPGQDNVPPSVPLNLTATVSDVNTVTLTWDPSVDNEPAAGGHQLRRVPQRCADLHRAERGRVRAGADHLCGHQRAAGHLRVHGGRGGRDRQPVGGVGAGQGDHGGQAGPVAAGQRATDPPDHRLPLAGHGRRRPRRPRPDRDHSGHPRGHADQRQPGADPG